MANEHMKRVFNVIVMEMLVKTTLRYLFIPTKMAVPEEANNNSIGEGVEDNLHTFFMRR